jgi:FixJ family two-component response regulator
MNAVTISLPAKMLRPPAFTPVVHIVDDDVSVREALEALVSAAGWRPETFASALEFLNHPPASCPSCLVLDVSLPDLNGLELQQRIANTRAEMPIIFITGSGDVPTSVRAMKAGAVEFLVKPFPPQALREAIQGALERSLEVLKDKESLRVLNARHQSLSKREREVMRLVVRGLLNKEIGGALNISEITVKAHRGRAMRKMFARSLPELVNSAIQLGFETSR